MDEVSGVQVNELQGGHGRWVMSQGIKQVGKEASRDKLRELCSMSLGKRQATEVFQCKGCGSLWRKRMQRQE